jgi:hypothetical protein
MPNARFWRKANISSPGYDLSVTTVEPVFLDEAFNPSSPWCRKFRNPTPHLRGSQFPHIRRTPLELPGMLGPHHKSTDFTPSPVWVRGAI